MKPLISIIVPMYNVEQFLPACLSSLLSQTYENTELILVDDGSPDRCGEIIDQFASDHPEKQITTTHVKNGGLSSARNIGLSYAKGEYILFVDSDDYVSAELIEKLYQTMVKNNADLSECSYFNNYYGRHVEIQKKKIGCFSREEALTHFLKWDGVVKSVVWNKLFRKDLIGNLRFDETALIGEDERFVYRYLCKCQNIAVIDDALYYYLIRDDSLLGNRYTHKKVSSVKGAMEIRDDCVKRFPCLEDAAQLHLALSVYFNFANLLNTVSDKEMSQYKEDIQFCRDIMKQFRLSLLFNNCSKKIAVLWSLCRFSPYLYRKSLILREGKR